MSDNQLDFFFSAFANKGELLDRMMLANKILKRNDAERVVKNNQQLANELKSIYRDVLSTMDHSLSAVTNLEKKQKIAGKQLQKLNANRDGDNFVKQFKVIKELHRWGTK